MIGRYETSSIVVVVGSVRYAVPTAISTVVIHEPVTASPWDELIVTYTPHVPRKLPRAAFFPAIARAPLPQHRPKQAPPRPAHFRAYQRHREARTRPERCA